MHVQQALQYLKRFNKHYKDIEFNQTSINDFAKNDNSDVSQQDDPFTEVVEASIDANDDELLHDRQQHCMFQDTCLMPVDIGQEALDQYFDHVLNIAPGQGNNPV